MYNYVYVIIYNNVCINYIIHIYNHVLHTYILIYIYICIYTAYYTCEFQWFAFRAVVSQLDLQLRSGPAVHIESLSTVAEKKIAMTI